MNLNLVKIAAIIIISFFAISSCQSDGEDELLVYNNRIFGEDDKLLGNVNYNLVGVFGVGNSIQSNPVEIQGAIKNGKMNFNFPDRIELNSEYDEYEKDGVRIGHLYIQKKDNQGIHFGLHKINSDLYNRVEILYSNTEYIPDNSGYYSYYEGITIKAGWNFIEILKNPNWSYENDEEPYEIFGLISQDVNDLLKKGYRWRLENWI